ncbi:MAG: exo-alpha-sialidase [Clostridia bacterium]|nr:exo-alpha-sialidase [Clostridia bacterium]
MLITGKAELEKYSAPYRLWQGIPAIEVTKGGRQFLAFYSGGVSEGIGNYAMLFRADDGKEFGDTPMLVAYQEGYRCYDPCLWIDPLNRLWFIWSCAPEHSVWASICKDPDGPKMKFGKPFKIGTGVMMNKPIVLSTGEWMFPIAVWKKEPRSLGIQSTVPENERKAFVYKTIDQGKTFVKIGGADVTHRTLDEHMLLEMKDEYLNMYVRTSYGIGVAHSYDRGKTWTHGTDSGIKSPSSRFFIRRLKSGRILLINHKDTNERDNLTAMLSEDEGVTWKYSLLLDERASVSYPDAVEAEDGYIHIVYDRERGSFSNSLYEVYSSAREVLMAKITEDDIIRGVVQDKGSYLKRVVSKLEQYALEDRNPFHEITRLSESELIKSLLDKTGDEVLTALFECYQVNCMNMHKVDNTKLDSLIEKLDSEPENKEKHILRIIDLIRSVDDASVQDVPIIEKVKSIIQENITEDLTVDYIAERVGISRYYMLHLFKKTTGLTITDYKNELKITKAKNLLIHTEKRIAEIAYECGFGSASYFSKIFFEVESISPSEYRTLLKINK